MQLGYFSTREMQLCAQSYSCSRSIISKQKASSAQDRVSRRGLSLANASLNYSISSPLCRLLFCTLNNAWCCVTGWSRIVGIWIVNVSCLSNHGPICIVKAANMRMASMQNYHLIEAEMFPNKPMWFNPSLLHIFVPILRRRGGVMMMTRRGGEKWTYTVKAALSC